MSRLKDKTALITGAANGIGETTARLFAAEGANVLLCDIDTERGEPIAAEINEAYPEKAFFFNLNVADLENWQQAATFAEEKWGALHILVNNAGISYPHTVADTTPDIWEKVIAVNQTGVYYGIQTAIASMEKTGVSGSVVSTASVDGHVGESAYFAYCASKAAVEAMTRCAAIYCGEKGLPIRVNAVAPGYVLTPMAVLDAKQNNMTIEEYCQESAARHPLGRLAQPIEIANAYLYMASDESSFCTGATLMADGGYTAW